MQEIKQFKIRCSAIGKIMAGSMGLSTSQSDKLSKLYARHSDPTAKPLTANMLLEYKKLIDIRNNPQLPQGAKTYCEDWETDQLYGTRRLFSSKYTEKGNINENESIEKIGEKIGKSLLKNTEFYSNEFMEGTPDVKLNNLIIDAKSSWDPYTFPRRAVAIPNLDYWWQVQGYMGLTDSDRSIVGYVLTNTPMHFIDRAAKAEASNKGLADVTEEIFDKYYYNMTFDSVDPELKIKLFHIERDDDAINQIKERVEACRVYLETIKIKS